MVFSWQLWQKGTLLLSIVALIEACQLVMQPQRLQQGNAQGRRNYMTWLTCSNQCPHVHTILAGQ